MSLNSYIHHHSFILWKTLFNAYVQLIPPKLELTHLEMGTVILCNGHIPKYLYVNYNENEHDLCQSVQTYFTSYKHTNTNISYKYLYGAVYQLGIWFSQLTTVHFFSVALAHFSDQR